MTKFPRTEDKTDLLGIQAGQCEDTQPVPAALADLDGKILKPSVDAPVTALPVETEEVTGWRDDDQNSATTCGNPGTHWKNVTGIAFEATNPNLLEIFLEEAADILDRADGVLAQWADEPDAWTHPTSLFRMLHTLKGGARMVGLTSLGNLVHTLETLLEQSNGTGSVQLINLLEVAFNHLHAMIWHVMRGHPVDDPQTMIQSLQQWSEKDPLPATTGEAAAEPDSVGLPVITLPLPPLADDKVSGPGSSVLIEPVVELASIDVARVSLNQKIPPLLGQQAKRYSILRKSLLQIRALPFNRMLQSLCRTVCHVAQQEGKRVRLHVDGATREMDSNLFHWIKAPLEHILRNAVIHGIEWPEARVRVGKRSEGVLHIQVVREAAELVVSVSDDGQGVNREAIRQRAIEHGLLSSPSELPDDEKLLNLMMHHGFSTADTVTQLAGRGVGMGVVMNQVRQLGGRLAIESVPGKGTTFELRLPSTMQ